MKMGYERGSRRIGFRQTVFLLLMLSALQTADAQAAGQIAGRVVRADSGAPIAGASVTLQASRQNPNCPAREDRSAKTSPDGSYVIAGLLPGCYYVVAYHSDFIGAIYPSPTTAAGQGRPVTVAAGQKVGGIDFRLQPAPEVTPMDDRVLRTDYPGMGRLEMSFGPARFSTDGRYIALLVTANVPMDGLWRYDMRTHELVPMGKGGIDVAWEGQRLYVLLNDSERAGERSVAAVTAGGLENVSQVPVAVQRVFRNDERGDASTLYIEENARYVVSSDVPCHGCGREIRVRRKGSKGERVIANAPDGFLFDREHSVVIYAEAGFSASLVAFELDTGRSRTLPLDTPYVASLLDGKPVPGGYLIAFASAGPCVPELTPDGQNPWILPLDEQYRREHSFPANVCFVTLPERRVPGK